MKVYNDTDFLIIGAGAAGLCAALTLAEAGKKVTVISDKPLGGPSSSQWAQGGFAAAVGEGDTVREHATDTIRAAAGTAEGAVVRELTGAAPGMIAVLERYGVKFARDAEGRFSLSREACHARRRVLKAEAGDGFGAELMRALVEAVLAEPLIRFAGGYSAERLIAQNGAVQGVVAREIATGGAGVVFAAPAVLMATGGIGGLYAATTNPLHSVGRGLALAARAGARLADLEFVQFHPTALDIGEDPAPLATEALRGEGAHLVNSRGQRFMAAAHEMAELAPRDVVSRAIFTEMERGQKVYLDCRHIDTAKFPGLLGSCARAGLVPRRDLVPVMPAVHYHMGGIATDLSGRSSVKGLWAAGECASTGLHGANRLASNSLLEAVVMGRRAAEDMAAFTGRRARIAPIAPLPPVPRILPGIRDTVRQVMSEHVGVVRDAAGLEGAIAQLDHIARAADGTMAEDMAFVGRMIAQAALRREESRGAHWRRDYPASRKAWARRSFTENGTAQRVPDAGVPVGSLA